ncbi:MAG: TRAP transporter large permease subunit, partial [Gammaproteobacteria bacterium]|nr:TRAP transporter large permease subunit [Gammaproteobacteria bacterium]
MLFSLLLFVAVILALLLGYPVALTLGGMSLLVAGVGSLFGMFDTVLLSAIPSRIYGSVLTNEILMAVPLFIFMGMVLERARIAEDLLDNLSLLFGQQRGGLAISVILVGMLLGASTGIVGATVVTLGLLSLPTLLKRGSDHALATGVVCASGSLGQIIPPSIVLVLLGDVLAAAYQQAQTTMGQFNADTVSVGDLFVGALIPGLLLVGGYIVYIVVVSLLKPDALGPKPPPRDEQVSMLKLLGVLLPPLLLMVLVLGSIIVGLASPTEAAGVGAFGALLLAWARKGLDRKILNEAIQRAALMSAMVFLILIGASIFSLVFRGFEGDEWVRDFLHDLPGGKYSALLLVMLV